MSNNFDLGPGLDRFSKKIGYARPAPSDAWHAKIGNVHFGGHVHYPIFVPQTVHFWGLLFRYRAGLSDRVPGPGRLAEQIRTGFEHRYHRVGGQIVEVIEFVSQLRIGNMVLAILLSMLRTFLSMLRTDRSLSA